MSKTKKCFYCNEEGHEFGEDCNKYLEIVEEREKAVKLWKDQHSCCPKCGSENHTTTLSGPIYVVGELYEDDINYATCECSWHGKVNQLKPKK